MRDGSPMDNNGTFQEAKKAIAWIQVFFNGLIDLPLNVSSPLFPEFGKVRLQLLCPKVMAMVTPDRRATSPAQFDLSMAAPDLSTASTRDD